MAGRYQAVALLGAPGTGKGTQGRLLGQVPGFYLFGSGDAFRALDPASRLGRRVHEFMRQGELVPDEVVIDVWRQHVADAIELGQFHPETDVLILDGLLRTVGQVELIEQYADLRQIFHMICADEEALIERCRQRAACEGRPDDADEQVMRHRLDLYHQATCPVLQRVPPELVVEIDALASPLEVLHQIVQVLLSHERRAQTRLAS